MKTIYSIKDVSNITGLSSPTIRYYEEEGLIFKINRNQNGVRQYTEEDIQWISFLAKLKQMEMPISDMKNYAELRNLGPTTITERKEILTLHKQRLNKKMKTLKNNLQLLDEKIALYEEMEKNEH